MAHHFLLLAFLPALLLLPLTTEDGSLQGNQTSPADTLQRPLQELDRHRYSRERRGPSRSKAGAGLRSYRTLPSPAKPEEDSTGPESPSPVGPDRDPLGVRRPSQAQRNDLMGTRKGRRPGPRNWHQHQFERKKKGRQNDKRRLGKGESSGSHTHKWGCIYKKWSFYVRGVTETVPTTVVGAGMTTKHAHPDSKSP